MEARIDNSERTRVVAMHITLKLIRYSNLLEEREAVTVRRLRHAIYVK